MNIYAAVTDTVTSLHDLSEHTSALSFFYIVIGGLLAIIAWFIIRDRVGIKETLDKLVGVVEELRLDLAANYVKKVEFLQLSVKVEKLQEHNVVRAAERILEKRLIEDGESK